MATFVLLDVMPAVGADMTPTREAATTATEAIRVILEIGDKEDKEMIVGA